MNVPIECPYCKHENSYTATSGSESVKKNCKNPLCFRDFIIEVNLITSATAKRIDFAETKLEGNEAE